MDERAPSTDVERSTPRPLRLALRVGPDGDYRCLVAGDASVEAVARS